MLSCFFKNQPNGIVLTANSRLARTLQVDYESSQMKAALSVWTTSKILPFSTWLSNSFHQTNQDGKILLSDFQELCLWEQVIRASTLVQNLWQPIKTAELIKQAFLFLNLWSIPDKVLEQYSGQLEVDCLIDWLNTFRALLKTKNAITHAELASHLKKQDAQNNSFVSDPILLIGFDDFPPEYQDLLLQLKKSISIEIKTLPKNNSETMQIILENPESELRTAAVWAKTALEKNTRAKVGCVISDLANQLSRVKNIFSDVFYDNPFAFNISAGSSISEYEMIKIGLKLLSFIQNPIEITQLSSLLQSPYLCFDEIDANMGAQMDFKLRELNYLTILPENLYHVISLFQNTYPDNTWLPRIRKFIKIQNALPEKLTPSEWVKKFIEILKSMRWPGQNTQDSDQFQLLERFKKCCREYAQCDFLFSTMTFNVALQLFKNLCNQTIFQPKSHHEPIQIMGMLEASAIQFDALWVMGLHDGIWPQATKPNPFIPIAIQQIHQMPHATAFRELQFCEQITERLKKSAHQVIFSSPAKTDDLIRKPSKLIQNIQRITQSELQLNESSSIIKIIFNSKNLEKLEDNIAPSIIDFSKIRGGSHILKLQAICPFRAFATIRLGAKTLCTPSIGIDAITKGNIVHQILYYIWKELKEQSALKKLSNNELEVLIDQNIITALEDQKIDSYFAKIEKIRLKKIIFNFLEFEKTRPDFKVVDLESTLQVKINNLPLKLRQDRIDQLADRY